ncbi:hypothetical protein ASF32_09385 [Methylobacterium sp. Leaf91]|nr:hypothetical protein ASF32_09385 [Methylobacterium sp. Leaf91]
MVADAPEKPSSKARLELGPETRSFHVALATGRKGGASLVLYYRGQEDGHGYAEVVILRVLPDRMEPRLRLAVDLDLTEDEDDTPQPGM